MNHFIYCPRGPRVKGEETLRRVQVFGLEKTMLRHLLAIFVQHQTVKIFSLVKNPQKAFKIYQRQKGIGGASKPATHYTGRNNDKLPDIEYNFLQKSIGTLIGMSAKERPVDRSGGQDNDALSKETSQKTSSNSKSSSTSIHRIVDGETLDLLRESYADIRKKRSNEWLHCANKSCFIYLYRGGGDPSDTLAAFDLDGTLIKPKSNKRIPRSATDWEFFSVWTKVKLQQILNSSKGRFVIFTNQNGVGLNIVPLEEVQQRIELVTKRLDIPCIVFVAIDRNEFRKPLTGMFQLFVESFNESKPINFGKSFYCGDAVGYPSHSDADIKFAQTLGLPFLPPEKFLRGVKPKLVTG